MKLYYFPGACSLADHIVLRWTGLQHQAVRVSAEAIKSPEYLRMNPNGNVPLLVHEDFVLSENAAILAYLAELRLQAGLLGDGSLRGRAEVLRWLAYLNSDVHGAFKPLFSPGRYLPDESLAEALGAQARVQVATHLQRLDQQLAGRQWLTGTRSIADPYLFVMLRWALRKDIALEPFPHLLRFLARLHEDGDVRAAIAEEEDRPELAAA
ncbi:MAG TPA: glutathione S-transferase N-terminal domain-containing protein [Stenotrophomonas sp.]|nr:glutathione S-transferase N-terminal domain-containing protein [Stenotrophomonas sp.]